MALIFILVGGALVGISPLREQLCEARLSMVSPQPRCDNITESFQRFLDAGGWYDCVSFESAIGPSANCTTHQSNDQTAVISTTALISILISATGVAQYFITFTFNMFTKLSIALSIVVVAVGGILLIRKKSVFFTIAGVAALGYYLLLLLISGVLEWRA